jgi:hypothetical protein
MPGGLLDLSTRWTFSRGRLAVRRRRPWRGGGMDCSGSRPMKWWDGESGGVHAMPSHQIPFLFRARLFLGGPQVMQLPEVGVHCGRVEHEKSSGHVPGIAEGVGLASGHPHEIAGTGGHGCPLEFDDDGALEDEECLRAVRVPVREWPSPTGGEGALHKRKIAISLLCNRLERHHGASSREEKPFTGSEDRRFFPGTSFIDPAY